MSSCCFVCFAWASLAGHQQRGLVIRTRLLPSLLGSDIPGQGARTLGVGRASWTASPRWVLTWRRGGAGSLGSPLRGHRSHHGGSTLTTGSPPRGSASTYHPLQDGDLTYGLWGTQTSVWSGLLCFSIMGGARRAWCRNGKYTDFPGASGAALPSAKGTHVWREEASQGTSCGQCGAYRGPPRAVFLQCGVCGGCGDAPWCLLWSWDVEGGFPPRSRPHWALLCSGHGDRPLGGHSEALYGPGSGCWTIPCRD